MDDQLVAAYLAGECTGAEKNAVETWRAASAGNAQAFERYRLLWEASRGREEDFEPDMQRAWQRLNPAPVLAKTHRKPGWFAWPGRVAAALLAGLLLAAGVYTYRLVREPAVAWVEKHTRPGEQRRLPLADGSVVWLNAGSRLRYPAAFTRPQREVFLEGEAFFEVARNEKKPFLIHAGGSTTRVLGTSFSVRSYAREPAVAVVVVTGKVAFSAGQTGQTVTLTPGEQGILRKKGNRLRERVHGDPNLLAWKTGTLTFRDAPLGQVLPTLEGYFGVRVRAAHPDLLNCRFTGVFRKPTLEEVLRVFAVGGDIAYRREGKHYLLSGNGCRQ
ncbi:MAG: Putative anti-sigma factor [uncultured Cytophagales bacterium]|uniref:Anti-sigma factor n=1 Tax=uncultured Cytophagales bacterium TaxID=158755 RepID=A0A6J4KPL9_9SPHI|nr:MAG: Putative anti-sigma factor [uncultured Cytophagales bacterium]